MKYKFDIDRTDLYIHDKPEIYHRTRNRLALMGELGMEEVGVAQFGIKDVMSGLYIEMVWSLSNEKFDDYLVWAKSLCDIKNKQEREKQERLSIMVTVSNKEQTTTIIDFNSGLRSVKKENYVSFLNPRSLQTLDIPHKKMKDFLMATLESYASFNTEFEGKTIEINVSIKEHKNEKSNVK